MQKEGCPANKIEKFVHLSFLRAPVVVGKNRRIHSAALPLLAAMPFDLQATEAAGRRSLFWTQISKNILVNQPDLLLVSASDGYPGWSNSAHRRATSRTMSRTDARKLQHRPSLQTASPTPLPPENAPVLGLTGLRKSYPTPEGTTKTVVAVASFTVPQRAQVAIKGESGSGKTTFLNLIAGIVKPDAGSIVLNGAELTTLSEAKRDRLRATTLGCVYQSFNLLQGYTCLENVLIAMSFGAGRDVGFATTLLERVGLAHRLSYYPKQLSIGQQQRVAVARALSNRPKLVLADEPTGNLDSVNATETLALLRQTCAEQSAALLLVSHDREILAQFENVAAFKQLNQPGGPS